MKEVFRTEKSSQSPETSWNKKSRTNRSSKPSEELRQSFQQSSEESKTSGLSVQDSSCNLKNLRLWKGQFDIFTLLRYTLSVFHYSKQIHGSTRPKWSVESRWMAWTSCDSCTYMIAIHSRSTACLGSFTSFTLQNLPHRSKGQRLHLCLKSNIRLHRSSDFSRWLPFLSEPHRFSSFRCTVPAFFVQARVDNESLTLHSTQRSEDKKSHVHWECGVLGLLNWFTYTL